MQGIHSLGQGGVAYRGGLPDSFVDELGAGKGIIIGVLSNRRVYTELLVVIKEAFDWRLKNRLQN
jgi:hypothetical protein